MQMEQPPQPSTMQETTDGKESPPAASNVAKEEPVEVKSENGQISAEENAPTTVIAASASQRHQRMITETGHIRWENIF